MSCAAGSRHAGRGGYSPELGDVVVHEVWVDFERGALSSWKWTAVRRGAALLDVFDRTGSVDLPPLPPWNVLRLPPTPGQLADQGNLHALVWTAQERLRELGVSAKTLQHYRYDGFDPIVRGHQEQRLTRYSAAVTAGLVDRSRTMLERGAMRPGVWRDVRKPLCWTSCLAPAGCSGGCCRTGACATLARRSSLSVPSRAAPRRVVREGFAAEDVRTLLEATVGDSIIQKRDRAIMTLAAQTGLRAGDLARLEHSDIDWRTNEIRLVQAKFYVVSCG